MRERLTLLIPCKNEERNIGPCIESALSVADEILVADSGSTDRTMEIAARFNRCRIIQREYVDSGNFKNWAIPQAACPWVLVLDADERITPPLAEEIARVLASHEELDGYWIYRWNYFLGHPIRFSGWRNDRVLRLFRRDLARYNSYGDHAEVVVSTGRVGRLRNRMLHYTYESYDQYFRKFHRYTTLQAQRWFEQGRRVRSWQLLTAGPLRFLRSYVLQLGFLDGLAGFQVCALAGYYSFMKRARLWELQHARCQADAQPSVNRSVGNGPDRGEAAEREKPAPRAA